LANEARRAESTLSLEKAAKLQRATHRARYSKKTDENSRSDRRRSISRSRPRYRDNQNKRSRQQSGSRSDASPSSNRNRQGPLSPSRHLPASPKRDEHDRHNRDDRDWKGKHRSSSPTRHSRAYRQDCPQLPSREYSKERRTRSSQERPRFRSSQDHTSKKKEVSARSVRAKSSDRSDASASDFIPPPVSRRARQRSSSSSESETQYHSARSLFITTLADCKSITTSDQDELECRKASISASNWRTTIKIDRPDRPKSLRTPITFKGIVNGVGASIIIDTGAEVDLVSPEFWVWAWLLKDLRHL